MTFLLDHDVPVEGAYILRREGHTARRLADQLPTTSTDVQVFNHAVKQGWVMVIRNRKDFLPLAASAFHAGLIILIRRKTRQAECAHLLRLLRAADSVGIAANVNFA